MKFLPATTLLSSALFLCLPHPAWAESHAESKQQIQAVVENFRNAIINKDAPGFMKLFLREDITWVAVYTDESVKRYNDALKSTKEPRAPKTSGSTPRQFIERIVRAPERRAETFSNVRIDTDGEVAQVWFDYSFMIENYRNNWGKESWQLVRTDDGWKIAAVVWSAEENPVPRP